MREPDIDNLPEKIHEGITLGPESLEEANEKFPVLPGAPDLSYLARPGQLKFRAFDVSGGMALRFPDGRMFRDVDVAFTKEDRERVRLGYICIRCLEPQSAANADEHLPGCIGVDMHGERYMRDGQHMIDVAAEFDEREIHVGPSRPIRAYLDEQSERAGRN